MTQTTFTDNVLVDGSQDIKQLRAQGHTTQTNPVQTWEDSAGTTLAQMTGDGRLIVGDDVTPDSLIEAHRLEASTGKPKRGFHSQGQIGGTLTSLVQWLVGELELRGSSAINALHTALRIRASNLNTGTPGASAELRGADIEVINEASAGASALAKATGLQVGVTNAAGKVITDAVGLRVKMNNAGGGTITNPYAIFTEGAGASHFDDYLEVKSPNVPTTPVSNDLIRIYPKSDGKLYAKSWSGEYDLTSGGSGSLPNLCNGRLALVSAPPPTLPPDPVTDVFSATVVYFTACMGNKIALYDGAGWKLDNLSEISIKLTDAQNGTTTNGSAVISGLMDTSQLIVGMQVSGTGIPGGATIGSINSATQITLSTNATASGTPLLTFKVAPDTVLDIFAFDNAGAPKLEMVAWTNGTTRAITLTVQDGVHVKSGALTRRYLGTIRTTSTAGQCEDSKAKRFVWNYYNRRRLKLKRVEGTDSWTYGTAAWRAANNNSANKVEMVIGVSEDIVAATCQHRVNTATTERGGVGIGLDSTTANSADLVTHVGGAQVASSQIVVQMTALYSGYPGSGYHYLAWLEYGRVGTSTFYGDNGESVVQTGMVAEVWG